MPARSAESNELVREQAQHWICLKCGYRLRGLDGDPIRCPECGHVNPTSDLEFFHDDPATVAEELQTGPAASSTAQGRARWHSRNGPQAAPWGVLGPDDGRTPGHGPTRVGRACNCLHNLHLRVR